MTVALEDAFFKAVDATTSRLLKEHVGDILNVKSFGAVGDGSTDDYASIQACFDAAFTSSGTPHGVTDAHLNKAVFLPPGLYKTETPLTLVDVYGARIFGSGRSSSRIQHLHAIDGLLIDGMKDCTFSDFGIGPPDGGFPTGVSLDLDWTNTGDVGLGNNLFYNFSAGGGGFGSGTNNGLRIGHSGNEGHCNQFIKCDFGSGTAGVGVLVEAGSSQLFQGGGYGGGLTLQCTGGSIHVNTVALAIDSANSFEISTSEPCTIQGVRTEATGTFLTAIGARVWVSSMGAAPGPALIADLSSNASVVFDTSTSEGEITATAGCKLYVRSCWMPDVDFAGLLSAGILLQNLP